MAPFDREIIEQVVAACQAGLSEAAQAFRRLFDESVELSPPTGSQLDVDQLPQECTGSGLILTLQVGSDWAWIVLPHSTGIVPEWCSQSDVSVKERLAGLAIELGARLLPQPFTVSNATGGLVSDVAAALRSAGLSASTARIAVPVQSGTNSGILSLLWPLSQGETAFVHTSSTAQSAAAEPLAPAEQPSAAESQRSAEPTRAVDTPGIPPASGPAHSTGGAPRKPKIQYQDVEDGIVQLPAYSRSLLKIKVPVMVTLAESKQPVENVLAIGPGSIIHFNKPCEDSLALEIDGQKVALGEAVKVGDKFGLWITSMILPEERFWVISNRPQIERAK